MSRHGWLEEVNYMNDPRTRAMERGKWYDFLDEENMLIGVRLWDFDENEDEIEFMAKFPARYGVCNLCEGHGKHVNPNIDASGLGYDDFCDDPDFYEDYHRGVYDVPCYECRGKRVVPEININILSDEQQGWLKRLQEIEADRAAYEAESLAERRMGA